MELVGEDIAEATVFDTLTDEGYFFANLSDQKLHAYL